MHYAKQDMFEKAILYFERASQIQTKEVKWQLMIASCYRRMNLFNEALKVYEEIHNDHQDNIDCLRGLVQIKKELGMPYQSYSEKLMVLDREEEAKRMMNGGQFGAGNQYGGAQDLGGYGAGAAGYGGAA
jgi:intraflagellar transport protein 88